MATSNTAIHTAIADLKSVDPRAATSRRSRRRSKPRSKTPQVAGRRHRRRRVRRRRRRTIAQPTSSTLRDRACEPDRPALTATTARSTALPALDLDAARKALNDHISAALPNEVGPALKLPLILSGLESAFASGKPFDKELASAQDGGTRSSVDVPPAAAAPAGLSRLDDALMQQFEAVMPDILAARDNEWRRLVHATRAIGPSRLLPLRPASRPRAGDGPGSLPSPTAARSGDGPRRDYAAAAALISWHCSAKMQAAAAPVAADIATAAAAADKLVTDLRTPRPGRLRDGTS